MNTFSVPVRFFTEVGIIEQLSRTFVERHLPDGMTSAQFGLLMHLTRQPSDTTHTPLALSRAMQVTKGAMTNTLQRLDARGLVEITPDPDDGRGKRVRLNAAGQAVVPTIIARLQPAFDAMAAEIDLEQVAAMLPMLETVRTVLDRDEFRAMQVPDGAGDSAG
ncbi:MAG: MarR family winged helix-turn-helix transcriptional regulator [Pseudomonadota bacterium]